MNHRNWDILKNHNAVRTAGPVYVQHVVADYAQESCNVHGL